MLVTSYAKSIVVNGVLHRMTLTVNGLLWRATIVTEGLIVPFVDDYRTRYKRNRRVVFLPPSLPRIVFPGKWNRKSGDRERSPYVSVLRGRGSKINGINVFRARSRFPRKGRPPRVDLRARRKILAARSRATSLWSRGLYAPIRSGSFLASKEQALSTCCKAKRKGWVHLSESIRRKKIATDRSPSPLPSSLSPSSRPIDKFSAKARSAQKRIAVEDILDPSSSIFPRGRKKKRQRERGREREFRLKAAFSGRKISTSSDEFFSDYRFSTSPSFFPIRTDLRV